MEIFQAKAFEGKNIVCKSRKLNNPVCGEFRKLYGGAMIIFTSDGVYGIFPHDVEFIKEDGLINVSGKFDASESFDLGMERRKK